MAGGGGGGYGKGKGKGKGYNSGTPGECWAFRDTGRCWKGDACPFAHNGPAATDNDGGNDQGTKISIAVTPDMAKKFAQKTDGKLAYQALPVPVELEEKVRGLMCYFDGDIRNAEGATVTMDQKEAALGSLTQVVQDQGWQRKAVTLEERVEERLDKVGDAMMSMTRLMERMYTSPNPYGQTSSRGLLPGLSPTAKSTPKKASPSLFGTPGWSVKEPEEEVVMFGGDGNPCPKRRRSMEGMPYNINPEAEMLAEANKMMDAQRKRLQELEAANFHKDQQLGDCANTINAASAEVHRLQAREEQMKAEGHQIINMWKAKAMAPPPAAEVVDPFMMDIPAPAMKAPGPPPPIFAVPAMVVAPAAAPKIAPKLPPLTPEQMRIQKIKDGSKNAREAMDTILRDSGDNGPTSQPS